MSNITEVFNYLKKKTCKHYSILFFEVAIEDNRVPDLSVRQFPLQLHHYPRHHLWHLTSFQSAHNYIALESVSC